MSTATIVLTREQKAEIADKMGLISDEIILSTVDSSCKTTTVEDLGENIILAASRTYTTSQTKETGLLCKKFIRNVFHCLYIVGNGNLVKNFKHNSPYFIIKGTLMILIKVIRRNKV